MALACQKLAVNTIALAVVGLSPGAAVAAARLHPAALCFDEGSLDSLVDLVHANYNVPVILAGLVPVTPGDCAGALQLVKSVIPILVGCCGPRLHVALELSLPAPTWIKSITQLLGVAPKRFDNLSFAPFKLPTWVFLTGCFQNSDAVPVEPVKCLKSFVLPGWRRVAEHNDDLEAVEEGADNSMVSLCGTWHRGPDACELEALLGYPVGFTDSIPK